MWNLVPILLLVLASSATAGGTAKPPSTVVHAARGILFLGGTRLDPPYALAYHDGKLAVNGFGFAPQPPPVIPPSSPEGAALIAAHNLRDAVMAEGHSNGWSDERILTEWGNRARKLPHIGSVNVSGNQISFVDKHGLTVIDMLPSATAHAPVNPDSLDAQDLRVMKEALDRGGVVFIFPDALMTFPVADVETFERVVNKMRRGESLTADESRVLDPDCGKLIRKPAALIRIP